MALTDDAQPALSSATRRTREAVVARYRKPLLAYFHRQTGDRAEAEDLTHDVLLRTLDLSLDQGDAAVDAYIFTMASNLLRDRARRRAARAADRHVSLAVSNSDDGRETLHLPADLSPADRVLIGRERLDQAIAALRQLPDRTRQVFVLFRLENMRQAEIARRLGISVSAVEKHVIKAAAHLARLEAER